MSIRSRIKSIENHLSNAYNSITNLGLYEDNTNKNMENISPLLDEFYNKVSDKTDLNQNGVVGRTSQETITEEAGTNVINTSIYIDDVNTDKESSIEMSGNTYQETTANVFNGTLARTTYTGTGAVVENSSTIFNFINGYTYTINIKFTSNNVSTVNQNRILGIRVYKDIGYTGIGTVISSDNLSSGTGSITFTAEENYNRFSFINYADFQSGTITITDFEIITNTPTPDYPQNIEVVTGTQNVEVCGKNLFDKDNTDWIKAYLTNSGIMYTSGNGKYCLGTNEYIKVLPNTTYYLSCSYGSNVDHLNNVFMCEYGKDKNYIVRKSHVDNHSFTTESNTQYIRLSWYLFYDANNTLIETNVSSVDTYVTNIQLEYGSTATTYEAYQGATYPVNLGNIELCKIDTYQDRIYKRNNKWYLEKKIERTIFNNIQVLAINGTASGTTQTSANGAYSILKYILSSYVENNTMYCDYAKYEYNSIITDNKKAQDNLNDNTFCMRQGTNDRIYFKNSSFTNKTGDEISTELNNKKLYYIRTTPTTTEITDTTLVNQLNALYNATIYPITNINTDTSNLLPYIDLTYNKVTPSPSPDRPSEIDTMTGDINYKISGKNLCNLEKLELLVSTNGNVIHNEYFQNVIINTTNINSLYISGDYTLLSDNALRIGGFNEYPVIDSQGTRLTLYENGSVDTTSYDYILLCFAVNTSVIEHTFDEIKNSFMVNIGSTATSYEPYISRTYQIKLGNIELCKINTYEDKIYSNDGKFYLEKNTGKVVLDGSENWNTRASGTLYAYQLFNVFDGNKTNGLSTYWKFISGGAMTTQTNECVASANTNASISVFTNNSYLNTITNFTNWLSTHNTTVYYILATPTVTEITSDNYPELYESLKQIQDYLVQYKINNEFILDYSSPNIEY